MTSTAARGSRLRTPWDTILGTKSHVRALRALVRAGEPMSVRELARRSGDHLRSVQSAVNRLIVAGIVERVGTGVRSLARFNVAHPLAGGLRQLFDAERARFDRVRDELRAAAMQAAKGAKAVWLREPMNSDADLEVGVLALSGRVDGITDSLREHAADLAHREDVTIDVRGWSRPDLEALNWSPILVGAPVTLLQGALPSHCQAAASSYDGSRSHESVDENLRRRAERIAAVIARRPELIETALGEIRKRIPHASPPEAKTLREWRDVLRSMRIPQLQRWLMSRGERATRLRQSMPLALVLAAGEDERLTRGGG